MCFLSVGGKQKGKEGYFVEPTIMTDVQDHFKIAREVGCSETIHSTKHDEAGGRGVKG